MDKNNNLLFAIDPQFELVDKVSKQLNLPISNLNISAFADGEIYCQSLTSVRNKRVFLIHTISKPVNDNLMKLFVVIDSFKRSMAKEINIIIPYFAYARQDRKTSGRTPITAKLVADLITTAGADRLLLTELHSDQIQGFFNIPIDHFSSVYIFGEYILKNMDLNNLVLIAPDYGSLKKTRILGELLNLPIAIIDKKRVAHNQALSLNVFGNVKDKNCFILDDIIDTGGTIIGAAQLLKDHGSKDIYIGATHGVFSADALSKFENAYKEKIISAVFVTDTLPNKETEFLKIISISDLLSKILKIYFDNEGSISDLYKKNKNDILSILQNTK